MGLYTEHILPWLLDSTEPPEFAEQRRLALREVRGDVLEIGLGTGLSLPFYPENVRALTAIEPVESMRRRAMPRAEVRGLRVNWHQGKGEALPFEDGQFDSVVLIDVLCAVDDVDTVFAEAYRVLRRGGRVHVLQHSVAPDEKVRRRQRRLKAVHRLFAGCRLMTDTDAALRRSGLEIEELVHVPSLPRTAGLYPYVRGVASRT